MTPDSAPSPPTTTLASRRIERLSGKVSGFTYETSIASSAPATPAYADETPNAIVLYAAGLTPDAAAAISPSRIARHARPVRPRTSTQATRKRTPAVTQAW